MNSNKYKYYFKFITQSYLPKQNYISVQEIFDILEKEPFSINDDKIRIKIALYLI